MEKKVMMVVKSRFNFKLIININAYLILIKKYLLQKAQPFLKTIFTVKPFLPHHTRFIVSSLFLIFVGNTICLADSKFTQNSKKPLLLSKELFHHNYLNFIKDNPSFISFHDFTLNSLYKQKNNLLKQYYEGKKLYLKGSKDPALVYFNKIINSHKSYFLTNFERNIIKLSYLWKYQIIQDEDLLCQSYAFAPDINFIADEYLKKIQFNECKSKALIVWNPTYKDYEHIYVNGYKVTGPLELDPFRNYRVDRVHAGGIYKSQILTGQKINSLKFLSFNLSQKKCNHQKNPNYHNPSKLFYWSNNCVQSTDLKSDHLASLASGAKLKNQNKPRINHKHKNNRVVYKANEYHNSSNWHPIPKGNLHLKNKQVKSQFFTKNRILTGLGVIVGGALLYSISNSGGSDSGFKPSHRTESIR